MRTHSHSRARRPLLPALTRLLRGSESESGVAAVEFALTAGIFLSLLIGVIELGRFAFTQALLYYAAEEGSRWAIVNPPPPADADNQTKNNYQKQLKDYVKSKVLLTNLIDEQGLDATINPKITGNADNTRWVDIRVSYTFNFLMPFFGGLGPILIDADSVGFLAEEEL
jgi:Flp pilus assembly protein TadG